MKKFGIDIMTANMEQAIKNGEAIGRILLPMPKGRQGWHDIMYVDESEIKSRGEDNDATGRRSADPNMTTARLAWDERGNVKKGTAHVRLDVTLPAEQDAWEAKIALGMNPEGQPVCRVALPDNGLCEVYIHGRLVTISGEGREAADWGSCQAEFRGRMIHIGLDGNIVSVRVTDEHRSNNRKPKRNRRRKRNSSTAAKQEK